jgi:hypothetical protein
MHFHSKQRLAIGLLAAGCRCSATAEACGVDRRTLLRWRMQPGFASAVQRLLNWELRQQQDLYVAHRVANEKARLANMAVRVAALRSPTATISQQRAAAGAVLRANQNFVNIAIHNVLQNVSYEKKDIPA